MGADAPAARRATAVPVGLSPQAMHDRIKQIRRRNPYAAQELGPFEWYRQWNETNPQIQREERPVRGRHVKQRVPDKAVYSCWYELTTDALWDRWFCDGNDRVLVRSTDPREMAAEVAAAWHAKWPTSTIVYEIPPSGSAAAEFAARCAARRLRTQVVTDAEPDLRSGTVNLVTSDLTARPVAPAGSLLLQHGIGRPWPHSGHCKSAGFTADSKDLGLSRAVADNHEFILDSNARQIGPSSVESADCAEPLDVDVSPGVSHLLEERYHNWRLAGHRVFKALPAAAQADVVRQETRQARYDRAMWLSGTAFDSEVPQVLATLEADAAAAAKAWKQRCAAMRRTERAFAAGLPPR